MRLWTIHPRYLDDKGLVAAWGEALLAQKVLSGVASGYRYHLQLIRFRSHPSPFKRRGAYLAGLAEEAGRRSYDFDVTKILEPGVVKQIEETEGPLLYELAHLREKLHRRLRLFTGSFGPSLSPNLIHYSASSPMEPESGRNDDPRSQAVILLSIAQEDNCKWLVNRKRTNPED